MTDQEKAFLTALSRGPIPDLELESGGFSLELATQLQRLGLVQHYAEARQTELTHLGWLVIPKPEYYRRKYAT